VHLLRVGSAGKALSALRGEGRKALYSTLRFAKWPRVYHRPFVFKPNTNLATNGSEGRRKGSGRGLSRRASAVQLDAAFCMLDAGAQSRCASVRAAATIVCLRRQRRHQSPEGLINNVLGGSRRNLEVYRPAHRALHMSAQHLPRASVRSSSSGAAPLRAPLGSAVPSSAQLS